MDGCWPLAPSFDTGGPMGRNVTACKQMMKALDPALPSTPISLEDVRVAVAWLHDADPGVRARVGAAAERFPRRAEVDFPLMPENIDPAFQREVADVHRQLFADHADLYGANVRWKVERALAVTDEQYQASAEARERYRRQAADALDGFDLLLVPTIGTVAPPRTVAERDLRPTVLRFTEPFNVLGWPALALPSGRAESGLPASVTLAARWNEDDFVLDVGLAFERYAATGASRCTASS
jgi:Asp-tRNA(Asn)/Glu-tRNA(Gln) amidotransferase A subunit family amidase